MQCPNEKEQKDKINNDLKKKNATQETNDRATRTPKKHPARIPVLSFSCRLFLSYEAKYIKRMLENNIKSFHFTFLYALLQMIASH